jgi:competence ComEA-like helix-hairpin-helix protein
VKRSLLLGMTFGLLAWPADKDVDRLPDGTGKAEVGAVCTECHGVANIRRQRLSRQEWTSEVSDMVDRGAKATDDQIAAIVDYLTANFGTDSKLRINTAPMVEIKGVLNLTARDADAIVAWRDAHGDFHGLDDLLKVPGVDAVKIEAKKEILQF